MTSVEHYKRYHVLLWRKARLRGTSIGVFSSVDVWGSEVRLGQWLTFDGAVLRSIHGERWPTVLQAVLEMESVRVEGEDASGSRTSLSQSGLADDGTDDPAKATVGRRPGRRRGTGLGVYVRHLRDVDDLDYPDVLQAVLASGNARYLKQVQAWGPHDIDRLDGLRGLYGDSRDVHESSCLTCRAGAMPD